MNQIKTAIIGMGVMGCRYAKMISSGIVQGMKIAAVTRITQERKEWLKEVFEEDVSIFSTGKELLNAVREKQLDIDAVMVVTPHLSHEELVTEALELGLHVLCDKPSGAYSRQARMMKEASEKREELQFGMIFNQRMNPIYQKMKEIVSSGKYGKMVRMNWIMTDWYRTDAYYASGSWRGTWDKEGGGLLLNQCPHTLDLMQWICGMPTSVQAFCKEGKYHDIEVEDEVTAYLEFANGATGTFYSTTGEASGINRFEVSMEDALLVYENNEIRIRELDKPESEYMKSVMDIFEAPKGIWKKIARDGEDLQHAGVLQNFVDAVMGKTELFIDGKEGGKSLTLSNAMYLSSWRRCMVDIPTNLDDEKDFEAAYEAEWQKKKI